jgi:CPA1 family monovalent cation:H+ antiporter
MEALVLIIVAVVVIAVSAAIAPRVKIAGPLILVIIGLAISLLPFMPAIEVDPEIILVGVLPPLLYSAAVSLPAIEFRRDFGPIAGLSVLLVVASTAALAFFFTLVLPGIEPYIAIALGAILSPTDAVATSIAKRLGISQRVVTLLEGESLLNDATALVLLRTSVAAVAVAAGSGVSLPAGGALLTFVWGVLVAVVIGGIVGFLNLRLRALVRHSAANTAIGFVVPFIAYLPTELLGGSGLVGAVVAGIVTGQGAARWFTPDQRLSDTLNWRTIELMLEGAVFLVMGLELKEIVDQNNALDQGLWHGVWLALAALGIILAVRGAYVAALVWLQSRRARDKQRQRLDRFSARIDQVAAAPAMRDPAAPEHRERRLAAMRSRISRAIADLDYYQASPLGWKHGTVIVWAGMRGVVTLAAAQTLPRDTIERPLLVFVAFLVAVGSLILQGFTLPWLVKMLRFGPERDDELTREEQNRLDGELRQAAASALSTPDLRRSDGEPFSADFVQRAGARIIEPPDDESTALARDLLELRLVLIDAMRRRLTELSSGGTFSTAALRHALAELDADQISLELRLRSDS